MNVKRANVHCGVDHMMTSFKDVLQDSNNDGGL